MKYIPFLIILLFVCSCEVESTKSRESGHLISFLVIPFNDPDTTLINETVEALNDHFSVTIIKSEPKKLPEYTRSIFNKERYRADSLLKYMHEEYSGEYDYVLAITNKDISFTKKDPLDPAKIKSPEWKYRDWGIFGLGSCPGTTCIISTFRLGKDKEILTKRLRKIVCHETGHMFGLIHCKDTKCLMTDAVEKIKTIDDANEEFCDECTSKIKHFIK